jgi:hypothetical protein
MKKFFFIITLAFSWLFSQAQPQTLQADSWKIKWNKKTILETGKENEAINTKKIKKDDLKKKCVLEITYKEADKEKEKQWTRSLLFFDEKDNQLLKKDSTHSVTINGADLKKLFGDKKKIKIYTIAIPTDPGLAARVRVRRVHLCTLELQ